MMTKPTLWLAACVVVLAGMFSGCQSSKIAYGNSYYLKQNPKPVTPVDKVMPNSAELLASTQPEVATPKDASTMLEQAQAKLLAATEKSGNAQLKESAQRISKIADEVKGTEMTKRETRAKRKELRQELQSMAKEYRSMAPDQTNALDQNLKVSLILLVAGLILALIPTAVTQVIGLLAFAAGLVFLIIWLVTEA